MADLGAIGRRYDGVIWSAKPLIWGEVAWKWVMVVGQGRMPFNASRNNTEGFAAQPCINVPRNSCYRFRWAVESGAYTISCYVKHPSNLAPRPTLVVKANATVGVNTDQTATSPSSAGWVEIGPLTVTTTATGGLWVELWNNYDSNHDDPCYFDLIQTIKTA